MRDTQHDLHFELLRATAAGDHLAFAELYRLTSARLYAVALRLLGNTDAAKEALQEACVRIWSTAEHYDPAKGQPLHWMFSVLRYICLDMRRRSAARPLVDIDLAELEVPVAPQEGVSPDLERCMKSLDQREARAIMMAVHYGMSHSELAQQLAMPLGSVKSMVRRALAKLRNCLGPEAFDVRAT